MHKWRQNLTIYVKIHIYLRLDTISSTKIKIYLCNQSSTTNSNLHICKAQRKKHQKCKRTTGFCLSRKVTTCHKNWNLKFTKLNSNQFLRILRLQDDLLVNIINKQTQCNFWINSSKMIMISLITITSQRRWDHAYPLIIIGNK